ncbi:MAG: hypothetical protein JWL70_3052 [Acidimicrobiia bacterium]|nr:hypothetical protein [Acidimicrobiia bacterium]
MILDVAVRGDDIHVSIYGGPRNVCGSVRFRFPDAATRRHQAKLLRHWQEAQLPVALLNAGQRLTLFREEALIARALGEQA